MNHPEKKALPAAEPQSFPKSARLLRRGDFDRVYRSGRRHFSSNLTAFYRVLNTEDRGGARVGFTTARALGNAVLRNRLRRRVREAVRRHLETLNRALEARSAAAEVVINPKRSALEAEFHQLEREVARAFDAVARAPLSSTGEAE